MRIVDLTIMSRFVHFVHYSSYGYIKKEPLLRLLTITRYHFLLRWVCPSARIQRTKAVFFWGENICKKKKRPLDAFLLNL